MIGTPTFLENFQDRNVASLVEECDIGRACPRSCNVRGFWRYLIFFGLLLPIFWMRESPYGFDLRNSLTNFVLFYPMSYFNTYSLQELVQTRVALSTIEPIYDSS